MAETPTHCDYCGDIFKLQCSVAEPELDFKLCFDCLHFEHDVRKCFDKHSISKPKKKCYLCFIKRVIMKNLENDDMCRECNDYVEKIRTYMDCVYG